MKWEDECAQRERDESHRPDENWHGKDCYSFRDSLIHSHHCWCFDSWGDELDYFAGVTTWTQCPKGKPPLEFGLRYKESFRFFPLPDNQQFLLISETKVASYSATDFSMLGEAQSGRELLAVFESSGEVLAVSDTGVSKIKLSPLSISPIVEFDVSCENAVFLNDDEILLQHYSKGFCETTPQWSIFQIKHQTTTPIQNRLNLKSVYRYADNLVYGQTVDDDVCFCQFEEFDPHYIPF